MRKLFPRDRVLVDRYNRTMANGGESGPGWFRSTAASCSNPVYRELRYAEKIHKVKGATAVEGPIITQEMWVRCRKCENCLRARRARWARRIRHELDLATRSWFGTLTLDPQNQFYARAKAQIDCERKGWTWSRMSASQQHAWVVRTIGKDITLFLKRLRKNSGARLRYALVAEQHKSGDPHFHLVIHEYETRVRHKTLKEAWHLGFTDFKLVEGKERAAWYVAKYLIKAGQGTRLRASAGYGLPYPLRIAAKQRDTSRLLTRNTGRAGHCAACLEPLAVLDFRDYGPSKEALRLTGAETGITGERLSYEPARASAPSERCSAVQDGEAEHSLIWYCPKGCPTDTDVEAIADFAARVSDHRRGS